MFRTNFLSSERLQPYGILRVATLWQFDDVEFKFRIKISPSRYCVKPSLFVNSQEQILLVHLLKCARQITNRSLVSGFMRETNPEREKRTKNGLCEVGFIVVHIRVLEIEESRSKYFLLIYWREKYLRP